MSNFVIAIRDGKFTGSLVASAAIVAELKSLEKEDVKVVFKSKIGSTIPDVLIGAGGTVDYIKGVFDSRHRAETRPAHNGAKGILLGDAGYVWQHYGSDLVKALIKDRKLAEENNELRAQIAAAFDEQFIAPIDACAHHFTRNYDMPFRRHFDYCDMIYDMNPPWIMGNKVVGTEVEPDAGRFKEVTILEFDKCLERAVAYSREIILRRLLHLCTFYMSYNEICRLAQLQPKMYKNVVVVPRDIPVAAAATMLSNQEIQFVIQPYFKRDNKKAEKWVVYPIAKRPSAYAVEYRCEIPREWKNINRSQSQIQQLTGAHDAIYCSETEFAAMSLDGAVRMAENAVRRSHGLAIITEMYGPVPLCKEILGDGATNEKKTETEKEKETKVEETKVEETKTTKTPSSSPADNKNYVKEEFLKREKEKAEKANSTTAKKDDRPIRSKLWPYSLEVEGVDSPANKKDEKTDDKKKNEKLVPVSC